MTALAAAVLFGIALIFQLFSISLDRVTAEVLITAGLLLLALHVAGIGSTRRGYRRR